jgi:hypothetical protein
VQDDASQKKAATRFASLAGTIDADKLVEALRLAAQDQLLETITGSGTVPSNMVAVHAELLYYVCRRAERILEQREVEVLFRTLPANARTVLATMHATYEEALRNQFLERMRRGARVVASGNDADGLRWTITFPDTTSFDTAWDEIERVDFASEASASRRARTIELPQELDDRSDPLKKLGLARPKGATTGATRSSRR